MCGKGFDQILSLLGIRHGFVSRDMRRAGTAQCDPVALQGIIRSAGQWMKSASSGTWDARKAPETESLRAFDLSNEKEEL